MSLYTKYSSKTEYYANLHTRQESNMMIANANKDFYARQNSVFGTASTSTSSSTSKYEKLTQKLAIASSVFGLVTSGVGIAKTCGAFEKATSTPGNNNGGTDNVPDSDSDAKGLKNSVKEAKKTGNWAPVKDSISSAQAAKDKNTSTLETINGNIDATKDEIGQCDKDIAQIKNEDSQMETYIGYQETNVKNAENALATAKKGGDSCAISKAETELHDAKAKLLKMQDKRKEYKAQIQEKNQEKTQLSDKMKDLTKDKGQVTSANEKLDKQIQEAQSEINKRTDSKDLNQSSSAKNDPCAG